MKLKKKFLNTNKIVTQTAESHNYIHKKISRNIALSSKVYQNIYRIANYFIDYLLEMCEREDNQKEPSSCPFKYIYGAVIDGSVSKKIATVTVRGTVAVSLTFFYQMNQRPIELCKFIGAQKEILIWIKNTLKIFPNQSIESIDISNLSNGFFKFIYKPFEFHISVASTYYKRHYCFFRYKAHHVHVYPFSEKELEIMAIDLIEEEKQHKKYISYAEKKYPESKEFMERNMINSLSMLRVYYMRKELINEKIQLAIIFLKNWQSYVLKDKNRLNPIQDHLDSVSIEILCVYIFYELFKSQKKKDIEIIDIIQGFFEIVIKIAKIVDKQERMAVIQWPYYQSKHQSLVGKIKKKDIEKYISEKSNVLILDNIVPMNVVKDFKKWRQLAEKSKRALDAIVYKKPCEIITKVSNCYCKGRHLMIQVSSCQRQMLLVPKLLLCKLIEQFFYESNDEEKNSICDQIVSYCQGDKASFNCPMNMSTHFSDPNQYINIKRTARKDG